LLSTYLRKLIKPLKSQREMENNFPMYYKNYKEHEAKPLTDFSWDGWIMIWNKVFKKILSERNHKN
jgi:hypothetical protein